MHHRLSCQGKKNDWVQIIQSHLVLAPRPTSITSDTDNVYTTSDTDDGTDDEYCSSEDEVLAGGMDTDDDQNDDVCYIPERITKRSGRSATRVSSLSALNSM